MPKDLVNNRPDEPLPWVQDPNERNPADPKETPPEGQGTDPKAKELDYTA